MAIDTSAFDQRVRPQDDLFRYVNGNWLEQTSIAPDRSQAGSFVTLTEEAEQVVHRIVEEARDHPADDEQRKIGDLFASFMDDDRAEKLGLDPIRGDLATVDTIKTVDDFVRILGSLERSGVAGIFGMFVGQNRSAPDQYIVHLVQDGLGLPDESLYRTEEAAGLRDAYIAHLERMLTLANFDDADTRAQRIFNLESGIAACHWDNVSCRDTQKTHNPMPWNQLRKLVRPFDWDLWRIAAKFPAKPMEHIDVAQPSFFEGLADLLVDENVLAWKDWLRVRIIASAAPYLSAALVEANFDFYGRTLSGTDELRPRWKRGVSFVEGAMGQAVGKIYVRSEFSPEAKDRMLELVDNLKRAYRQSITALSWMSPETKTEALAKLDAFTAKIGYPDEFRDYSTLETDPGDLIGNARRAMSWEIDREMAKVGQPVDRGEWFMPPQMVNAYYSPNMNEIVFPAAILQPPFFDVHADDPVNYGAIGAVIGHEIGHGFDDQGSQYDGTGLLRDWWTEADRAAFEERTSKLIDQYSQLSPEGADGQTVNGELTIGENIGDLGGLGIAYKAMQLAIADSPDPKIDGLTADQRFFISWAQAWQLKTRPAEAIRRLTIDPHAPPEFRCNQVLRNIDAFHKAFDVNHEHTLWMDPADRVIIW